MAKGKLTVALISGGMISNAAHIPAYRNLADKVEIVAVCDIHEPTARATAQRWEIPAWYTDAAQMLEREKPDLVSVCTSNAAHKEMSLLALNSGANVLCEKPLAFRLSDAKELFDAAAKNGKMLVTCQSSRFTPEYLDARELVEHGCIGDVYFAEISRIRRRGVPTWGNFHRKDINGGGALLRHRRARARRGGVDHGKSEDEKCVRRDEQRAHPQRGEPGHQPERGRRAAGALWRRLQLYARAV